MSPPLARWSQKDCLPLARIHTPGIEPGPAAWKAVVLPLHHVCSVTGEMASRADYILCSSQNSVLRVRYLGLVLAGPSEAPSRRSTHLHLSLETEVIDPSQVTVQCACHKGFEQCGPVQYHCTDRSEDDFFSARVTISSAAPRLGPDTSVRSAGQRLR